MDADSNSNLHNSTNGEDNPGASSRVRTQSECSLASDDGQASNTDKRLVNPIYITFGFFFAFVFFLIALKHFYFLFVYYLL